MLRVTKQVTIFEFGYLSCDAQAANSTRIKLISTQAFSYLKKLVASEHSASRFLGLKFIDSCDVLQVKNYVGVVLMPDGTQIEVLPKVAKKHSDTEPFELTAANSRDVLLNMLKTSKGFLHIKTNNANLAKAKMPLLEVFISQFLIAVNELIKQGLRSDYVREQDNLAYLKGKLLVNQYIQHNFVNRHKFYAQYDQYRQDRPVNH